MFYYLPLMMTNCGFFYKVYKNVHKSYKLDQRQSYIVFRFDFRSQMYTFMDDSRN